jgi:hypothetical protein
MANEKNIINVELYDLPITGRKDDLIAVAVARRTDLSAATMRLKFEYVLVCT